MLSCQAATCLNCTMTTSSLFLGEDQGGNRIMLSRAPCNATVMPSHRSCGWFPSESRGTTLVGLSVLLIGAGTSWGMSLHLTLSPSSNDSVKVGTDYLKKKRELVFWYYLRTLETDHSPLIYLGFRVCPKVSLSA